VLIGSGLTKGFLVKPIIYHGRNTRQIYTSRQKTNEYWVVFPPCPLSPIRESAEENAQRRGSEIAVMMYGYLVVTRFQDAQVQVIL